VTADGTMTVIVAMSKIAVVLATVVATAVSNDRRVL
jgi:hypothetical protein